MADIHLSGYGFIPAWGKPDSARCRNSETKRVQRPLTGVCRSRERGRMLVITTRKPPIFATSRGVGRGEPAETHPQQGEESAARKQEDWHVSHALSNTGTDASA